MNNCNNCFGCIGLKHQEYCILNKQYSKEEYEQLVPKLIEHMQSNGEWGEFFPIELSPFAYNETNAFDLFPIEKADAEKHGWKWQGISDDVGTVEKSIPGEKLPDSIKDIPDDILNWAVVCPATDRPFRIVKKELALYRQKGLPVPRLHPNERHRQRLLLKNPRMLCSSTCKNCGKSIRTTYASKRPEIVYCEECYLARVY
jgi:hypothetical protein